MTKRGRLNEELPVTSLTRKYFHDIDIFMYVSPNFMYVRRLLRPLLNPFPEAKLIRLYFNGTNTGAKFHNVDEIVYRTDQIDCTLSTHQFSFVTPRRPKKMTRDSKRIQY